MLAKTIVENTELDSGRIGVQCNHVERRLSIFWMFEGFIKGYDKKEKKESFFLLALYIVAS